METPFLVDSKHGGAPVRGGWAARGGVGEQFLILCSFCVSTSSIVPGANYLCGSRFLHPHQMLLPQHLIKVSKYQIMRSATGKQAEGAPEFLNRRNLIFMQQP